MRNTIFINLKDMHIYPCKKIDKSVILKGQFLRSRKQNSYKFHFCKFYYSNTIFLPFFGSSMVNCAIQVQNSKEIVSFNVLSS